MPSQGGIKAGRAYVELGVGDKLTGGLKRAQARLRAFGEGVTRWGTRIFGVGSAFAAPAVVAAKSFASMGDQVANMAKRTGLSVETLSGLRFVASQTGTEFGPGSVEGNGSALRAVLPPRRGSTHKTPISGGLRPRPNPLRPLGAKRGVSPGPGPF